MRAAQPRQIRSGAIPCDIKKYFSPVSHSVSPASRHRLRFGCQVVQSHRGVRGAGVTHVCDLFHIFCSAGFIRHLPLGCWCSVTSSGPSRAPPVLGLLTKAQNVESFPHLNILGFLKVPRLGLWLEDHEQ